MSSNIDIAQILEDCANDEVAEKNFFQAIKDNSKESISILRACVALYLKIRTLMQEILLKGAGRKHRHLKRSRESDLNSRRKMINKLLTNNHQRYLVYSLYIHNPIVCSV